MSETSFSFRNIFLGVLLGMAVVIGWAFYPQLQSAVETQAPLVLAKLSPQPTAEPVETDSAPPAPVGAPEDSTDQIEAPQATPPPVAPAAIKTDAPEPVARATPQAEPSHEAPADPLEASPGWNPDVARALIEPIQALQKAAAGEENDPAATTTEAHPTAAVEQTAPEPALPEPTPADDTRPPRQQEEEARWQTLLALPFFPEQAADYPFGACFKAAAVENHLPLPAVLGMAALMSNFDPEVVSDTGAGILNVGWPRPAKSLGIEGREILTQDPCVNISAGARHLAALLKESQGQWVPALAAYQRQVAPAYLGRIRPEDLHFSQELRRHVREVIRQPYQPKTMYAFWEFDEQITARRFMELVQNQSGVQLWMRQHGFSYVIYIPAADPREKDRKLQLIEQETGLQAVLTHREDAPS